MARVHIRVAYAGGVFAPATYQNRYYVAGQVQLNDGIYNLTLGENNQWGWVAEMYEGKEAAQAAALLAPKVLESLPS